MPRSHGLRWGALSIGLLVGLLTAAGAVTWLRGATKPAAISTQDLFLPVVDGPAHDQRIRIDSTEYLPAHTPAPAVIVSPGFGETKTAVDTQARELAQRGFVVLAYTPRGFGHSTGQIGLNSPDYEVADARQLVDWLATRHEVTQDRPGDPRVGVTGGSYGGALSLLLAGTDKRVDAVAAMITYNDLSTALLPNDATTSGVGAATPAAGAFGPNGVFKRTWAGLLFAAGLPRDGGALASPQSTPPNTASTPPISAACGRFVPEVCQAYEQISGSGQASPQTVDLLRRDSPVSVAGRITVPTLLVQGEQDTLFGLDQADATARQISQTGDKVKVIWYNGGHDGGAPGPALRDQIGAWLTYQLTGAGPDPGTSFQYDVQGSIHTNDVPTVRTITATAYPGLASSGTRIRSIPLTGFADQQVINPPGGNPAAVSGLPGVGSTVGAAASRLSSDVPGEFAMFTSAPLSSQLLVAGAPRVTLRISAAPGQPNPGEAVLFVKLYDQRSPGQRVLPGSAVAPIRVGPLPASGAPVTVTVTLPGVVAPVQSGHQLVLVVSTTDQSYANASAPSVFRVSLADGGTGTLSIPVVPGGSSSTRPPTGQLIGIAAVLALCALAGGVAILRGRRTDDVDPALVDAPLSLTDVSKSYPSGVHAVSSLSFRVDRGHVVGLLGPNGAGKTTTLRMMMGLIYPSGGTIRVFGHRVRPGAPVLSRIGCFVEGAGFLPHLSGRANLRLYWEATGRPLAQARFDEALEIAALGDAINRKVSTYSHGMRQRLAIAQAMLGLPDLLVLDEPTNGLDPPQIREMRDVLRHYAATGRTVLVSSHLLAEIEQTCTRVVVMHRGRLVAVGDVDDIVTDSGETTFQVNDPQRAAEVLRALDGVAGISTVDVAGGRLLATLNGVPRAQAVDALVRAGVEVDQVTPHGRLEDAFLQLVGGQGHR